MAEIKGIMPGGFELITTGKFAKDFGLIYQINRSSVSVMDNIAVPINRVRQDGH
jgi:23S rRNA-intervening sequence protein